MALRYLLNPSRYKKLLLREKEELLRRMEPLSARRDSSAVVLDADQKELFDQLEIPLVVVARLSKSDRYRLMCIEYTLRKFENNSFGTCETCSTAISPARLKLKPTARSCLSCREKLEADPWYSLREISTVIENPHLVVSSRAFPAGRNR